MSFVAANFLICTTLLFGPKTNVDPKTVINIVSGIIYFLKRTLT